jgi:hypothetical protein
MTIRSTRQARLSIISLHALCPSMPPGSPSRGHRVGRVRLELPGLPTLTAPTPTLWKRGRTIRQCEDEPSHFSSRDRDAHFGPNPTRPSLSALWLNNR